MAMLSLLLLVFAVHLRVETERAAAELNDARARMAARYALAKGIAHVRQALSGDRAVTAPWPVGGDEDSGWTGVWETVGGRLVCILVSGVDAFGSGGFRGESVAIARRNADEIRAGLKHGDAGIRYAWWVDDDGCKAALRGQVPMATDDQGGESAGGGAGTLAQVLAPVAALPAPTDADAFAALDCAGEFALRDRLIAVDGLCLFPLWQNADPAALASAYTLCSRGVPVDTRIGGLRRNLAAAAGEGDGDAWLESMQQVLAARVDPDGMITPRGWPAMAADGANAIAHFADVPRPVVTEAGLYLWLARCPAPQQHQLKVHLTVRLNLWNPYAARLRGAVANEPAVIVELWRLPPMVGEWTTGGGSQSGVFQLNPSTVQWRPDSDQAGGAQLHLERLPIMYPYLDPGEVRTFSIRLTGILDEVISDPTPHAYTDDSYSLRTAAGELDVRLILPDKSLVVEFQRLSFAGANSADYRTLPLRAVSMTGSPVYADAALLWHWALREDAVWSDDQPPAEELRSPRFMFSAQSEHDHTAGIYSVSPDPGAATLDLQVFGGRPAFFYGGNGSLARNYVVLYDYPTTHPVSLAYLVNAPLVMGDQLAHGISHDLYDRFFYLPDSTALSPAEQWHFGNRYSGEIADAAAPLVLGSFNINSTSVAAWQAVLGSRSLRSWMYRTLTDPCLAGDLRNAVFRFPHCAAFSGALPWDVDPAYPEGDASTRAKWYRDSWTPQWMRAWSAGARLLTDGEVAALAESIVERLRQRTRPFLSLAEAAADPWLQEAIDRTAINSASDIPYVNADPDDRFPRHSPAAVSQMDIIALIAPFWAVRSDTFTIRGYGCIEDTSGQPGAEAWCEARIQRLPTGEPDHRPFVVEYFRWLRADEL